MTSNNVFRELAGAGTNIHHKYVFTTGESAHAAELANRCINAGVATRAIDSEGALLLPKRFRRLSRAILQLEGVSDALESSGVKRWFAFARRPRTWPLLAQVALRLIRTKSKHDGDSPGEDLQAMIDRRFAEIQASAPIEALAASVDTEWLRPQYRATHPWCRLTLPSATVGFDNEPDSVLEVTGLVHRSGVVVLTLIDDQPGSTIQQINASTFGANPRFRSVAFSRELVVAASKRDSFVLDGAVETATDQPDTVLYETAEGVGIVDIFLVYRDAIFAALVGKKEHAGTEEWFGFPVVHLRQVADDHLDFVAAALSFRLRSAELDPVDILPLGNLDDVLGAGWARFFLTEGGASHAFTGLFRERLMHGYQSIDEVPEWEWGWYEFSTALAVDTALLRIWIVEEIARQLEQASVRHAPREEYNLLLQSYREVSGDRILSAGQLGRIEAALLAQHNFSERLAAVRDQAQMVRDLKLTEQTVRSTQAVHRLEVLVLAVSIMFGLPGLVAAILQNGDLADRMPRWDGSPFSQWAVTAMLWTLAVLFVLGGGLLLWWIICRIGRMLNRRRLLVPAHKARDRRLTVFEPGPTQFVKAAWDSDPIPDVPLDRR